MSEIETYRALGEMNSHLSQEENFGSHFVYFVGSGNRPRKVGNTRSPTNRMSQLQTNYPYQINDLFFWGYKDKRRAQQTELSILYHYRPYLIRGEWIDWPKVFIDGAKFRNFFNDLFRIADYNCYSSFHVKSLQELRDLGFYK